MPVRPRIWLADRRVVIALIALVWVVTRGVILEEIDPDSTDVELYFRYAVQGIDQHQVPYRDFDVEYPPLAYWFAALPRLVDRTPVPAGMFDQPLEKSAVFWHYGWLYEAQCVVCDLAALVLLLSLAQRRWPEHFVPLAAGYLGVTTMLWPVLFVRLDIALAALLMAWAWCWTKADDCEAEQPVAAWRWRLASYAALGLGVSFKLVPIVMAPFLLLAELRSAHPWRRTAAALAALATTSLLPFAVHVPSAGAGLARLFDYHGTRGIQVESLYASLFAVWTHWQLELEHTFGSWNLTTDWTPALKTCSSVLVLSFLAVLGLWSVRAGRTYSRERALAAACLALSGAVIFAKVLSPQYFLWALPLALLLAAAVLPRRWAYTWLAAAGLIAVARTTTWIFPYHYGNLLEPRAGHAPWVVLLVRNLVYLGLLCWLGLRLISAGQRQTLSQPETFEPALRSDPDQAPHGASRRATNRAA